MTSNRRRSSAIMFAQDALPQIRSQRIAASIIPFVGAGFSCNISHLMDFELFLRTSASALLRRKGTLTKGDLYDAFDGDAPRALEYLCLKLGQRGRTSARSTSASETGHKIFEERVKAYIIQCGLNGITDRNASQWKQHIKLVEKFTKTIYTTNWDRSIEYAAEHLRRTNKRTCHKTLVAVPGSDGPAHTSPHGQHRSSTDTVTIYKYHGDIGLDGTLLATEADFYSRLFKPCDIDRDLSAWLQQNALLYIGYSIADVNLRYTLTQIARFKKNMDRQTPMSYLVDLLPFESYCAPFNEYLRDVLGVQPVYLFDPQSMDGKCIESWTAKLNDIRRTLKCADTNSRARCLRRYKALLRRRKPLVQKHIVEFLQDI